MKRFALAVLAGTAATGIGLGSASALGVGGAGLHAAVEATSVAAGNCDPDGVGTELGTAFRPGLGYAVASVSVTGIDSACAGRRLRVALTDPSGMQLTESAPVDVPAGGGTVTVPVDPVAVGTVGRVHTLLG
jgi:hypothetical protein